MATKAKKKKAGRCSRVLLSLWENLAPWLSLCGGGGGVSGRARPWLICFHWCALKTPAYNTRDTVLCGFSHTHTHTSPPGVRLIASSSTLYLQLISSSLRTLKGCFVSLFPQAPRTLRLASSRRYLFTMAWICTSLSQLPSLRGSDPQICMKVSARAERCPSASAIKPWRVWKPADKSRRYGLCLLISSGILTSFKWLSSAHVLLSYILYHLPVKEERI